MLGNTTVINEDVLWEDLEVGVHNAIWKILRYTLYPAYTLTPLLHYYLLTTTYINTA